MRQGMANDGFVFAEDGSVSGLLLTADSCAEHEWGLKGINRRLGITVDSGVIGMGRHLITNGDNILHFEFTKNKERYAILTTLDLQDWELKGLTPIQYIKKNIGDYISSYRLEPKYQTEDWQCCAGTWAEEDFLFVAKGVENVEKLRIVHDAFKQNDVAIFGGGRNGPFTNTGLCIAIYSKMSEDLLVEWIEDHNNTIALNKAVADSGIEKILTDAGCGWYALAPDWDKDGNLQLFLNPREQRKHNFGWFTIDQLKQWAEGNGPIMKE